MIGATSGDNANWIPPVDNVLENKANMPILDSIVFEWQVNSILDFPEGIHSSRPFFCAGLEW